MLIGNLTRDPELRYTPNGQAVASFGMATNRRWTDRNSGERKEAAEFHEIVTWGKQAETVNQILKKGRQVFVEGRLQTRSWEAPDGSKRSRTEIVAQMVRVLGPKMTAEETTLEGEEIEVTEPETEIAEEKTTEPEVKKEEKEESVPATSDVDTEDKPKEESDKSKDDQEEINLDDIPF